MFIYNLPYPERKSLCRILDLNNAWEQLGGTFMKFDVRTLQIFEQAPSRSHSPTDEMLTDWGTHNHTVLELFILLSEMQHYQAMMVLKPLVDEKYHKLIYEGEENFSRVIPKKGKPNVKIHPTPQERLKEEDIAREINGNLNMNFIDQESKSNKHFPKEKLNTDKVLINFEDETLGAQQKKPDFNEEAVISEGLSPSITYAELERATACWDRNNLLGKGGFGTVYKGFWKNTEVAIKRLEVQKGIDMDETYKTNRKQSLRELKCLNTCRHDNILPLYGYSIGGPHDCLVYQYMPNGSLEDRLLCREGTKPLTWSQRHSIATGTARGLQYLHTIGDKPLVHGDIKSANILLDPYLVPKIGDFGLAREGPLQQYTHVKVSKVHGTRPYLPDEFLRAKKFSTKVDTFSFGVVLFELATGLRAYDESRTHKYLREHVESMSEEKINDLRDTKAGYDDGNSFFTLISIGHWCVSVKPRDRPEMVQVLQKLDQSISDWQPRRSNSNKMMSPIAQIDGRNSASSPRRNSYNNKEPFQTPMKQPDINIPIITSGASNSNSNHRCNGNSPNYSQGRQSSRESFDDNFMEEGACRPVIRVEPPSSPILSDLLPPRDSTGACNDLPLISALGIKADDTECEAGENTSGSHC